MNEMERMNEMEKMEKGGDVPSSVDGRSEFSTELGGSGERWFIKVEFGLCDLA
jgi:hypothetical protein